MISGDRRIAYHRLEARYEKLAFPLIQDDLSLERLCTLLAKKKLESSVGKLRQYS